MLQIGEILQYMESNYQHVEALMFGLLFGTAFYFVHWIFDNTPLRHQPFGRIILIKTFCYIVGFSLSFFYSVFYFGKP